MPRVSVIRCHSFRDARVHQEVATSLDRRQSVRVLCPRDRGVPLREQHGRPINSRMPMHHSRPLNARGAPT